MLKKYRVFIIIILIIVIFLYLNPSTVSLPVEKMAINSGIGFDLIQNNTGEHEYLVSISPYTFNDKNKIYSMSMSGEAYTIPGTRASRQMKSNHKFIAALQKVVVLSEEISSFGIGNIVDILFTNKFMNDMGWVVVCKGSAQDMLNYKIDEYPSASDYIDGLIENANENYFNSANYKIMDVYVRADAEGRNIVLPYIETDNNKIEITGLAIFKGYTMVKKIDINQSKILNFLREDGAMGILELKESLKKYASVYGKTKRKVSCEKSGSQYKFIIDISFSGNVIANSLIKDLEKKPEVISELEKNLAKQTEDECYEFINKMRSWEVDCFELGRVACAKYGRKTGVDWNDIVSKSDIKVNIKVKVTGFERGTYFD